ncbi:MAG: pyridoxamine 5'-phosphate oxidase family protein [Sciscionella sp.]
MGKQYTEIEGRLREFLLAQPLFFVGSAPSGEEGHVNISPKGMAGTFAVLGPSRVAYLDYTGSGTETIAHVRQNGRIVLMFCAFSGPPKIVRLHGSGRVVACGAPEFDALRDNFGKDRQLGQRSIIVVEVSRIADSCGYSVPRMDFVADRDVLDVAQARRDPEFFAEYWRERNARSIDGLAGFGASAVSGAPAPSGG